MSKFYAFINDISAIIFDNKVNADSLCRLSYFLFFVIWLQLFAHQQHFTTKFLFCIHFPILVGSRLFLVLCLHNSSLYAVLWFSLALAYSALTLLEANIKLTFQTKIEKKLKIMIRITKSHVINVVIQRYAPFQEQVHCLFKLSDLLFLFYQFRVLHL